MAMDPGSRHTRYQSLSDNEDPSEFEETFVCDSRDLRTRSCQPYAWLGLLFAFLLIVLTSIQVTLLTIESRHHPAAYIPRIQPQPCGSNVHQARSKGCIFSLGLAAWVPPTCYDTELEAEFISNHPPVNWYYDLNHTQPIPNLAALSEVETYAYTDWFYHKAHCTHTWKLAHRAIERGWMVRDKIRDYNHPLHCEGILLGNKVPDDLIWTQVDIEFPECVSYDSICSGGR